MTVNSSSQEGAAEQEGKEELWSYSSINLHSIGERLLPFFMAAMETCWIAAVLLGLADLHFMQSTNPALPLWTPFVFIAGTAWIVRSNMSSTPASRSSASPIVILGGIIIILTLLYSLWSGIYATSTAFYNPVWLFLLLNDILLFSPALLHALGILVILLFCCWRGRSIGRHDIEPGMVFRSICIGMAILLICIFLATLSGGPGTYSGELFLFVPLFLALALITHSVAHVVILRHSYIRGLAGSIAAQETSLFITLTSLCTALLLLAFVAATLVSPAFLAFVEQVLSPIGKAYDWLIRGLTYVIGFILSPLFYLIQAIKPKTAPQPVQIKQFTPPQIQPNHNINSLADTITSDILHVLLPVLFVMLIIVIVTQIFKRRRRLLLSRQQEDHESIWSWQLFWEQLRMLLLALKQRFLRDKTEQATTMVAPPEIIHEPAVRNIREIYRAFLQQAAYRGHQRQKDETPHEFRDRINQQVIDGHSTIATVTTAYEGVRYGGNIPSAEEIERVKGEWQRLQQLLD